jgi:hypothetical protein
MTGKATALLYAVTIAGYALVSAVPPLIGVESRVVSIPYRALALGLALMVIFLAYRRRQFYRGAAWFPLLTFWLFYTVRIVVDTEFRPVQLGRGLSDYVLWAFGTCFIPLVAFFQDPGEEALRLAAKYTFWFCLGASALALYVTYRELSLGISAAYSSGRIGSDTLNPVSLGHLGVSLSLLSIYYFPLQRWYNRVLLVLAMIVGLFIAGASGSRGPVVAFGAAVLFLLASGLRGISPRTLAIRLAAVVFCAWALVQGASLIEGTFGFRIVSRFQSDNQISRLSSQEHLNLATDAQREFMEHPLFGNALEETNSQEYPHNIALESFMATGVLGGFMFSAFLLWALVAGFSLARAPAHRWIALLLVQQVVAGLTAGALSYSSATWCLSVAAIAIAETKRRADQAADYASASPGDTPLSELRSSVGHALPVQLS